MIAACHVIVNNNDVWYIKEYVCTMIVVLVVVVVVLLLIYSWYFASSHIFCYLWISRNAIRWLQLLMLQHNSPPIRWSYIDIHPIHLPRRRLLTPDHVCMHGTFTSRSFQPSMHLNVLVPSVIIIYTVRDKTSATPRWASLWWSNWVAKVYSKLRIWQHFFKCETEESKKLYQQCRDCDE